MVNSWQIRCSAEQFDALRGDDGFAVILALARSTNQIRFAVHSLEGLAEDDASPFAARQQTSAILSVAAALIDGVEVSQKHVGQHFRSFGEFALLQKIWKDASYARLLSGHLRSVRNAAVSHFDPTAVKRVLLSAPPTISECVFADGQGTDLRNIHYGLADVAAILILLGSVASEEDAGAQMTDITKHVGALAGDFVAAADALIGAALNKFGFTLVRND